LQDLKTQLITECEEYCNRRYTNTHH